MVVVAPSDSGAAMPGIIPSGDDGGSSVIMIIERPTFRCA